MSPRLGYRPRGEEIDGSFELNGRHFLLEAKWTKDPHPASSLYRFRGKVEGKLVGTIGFFVSMSGFSEDAVEALVAGKQINVILVTGEDVRLIASGDIGVREAFQRKLRAAAETGAVLFPASDFSHPRKRIWLVEGPFDQRVLTSIAKVFEVAAPVNVIATQGPSNMARIAQAVSLEVDNRAQITAIVDGNGLADRVGPELDHVDRLKSTDSVKLIVLQPDLDAALGLVGVDSGWDERRRLRKATDQGLIEKIKRADLRAVAERTAEVRDLLNELGVN